MSERPWILLITGEAWETVSVANQSMRRLGEAVEALGYTTTRTTTPEDGLSLVVSSSGYGCVVLDWDMPNGQTFDQNAAVTIIRAVRSKSRHLPIFLIADKTLVSDLPLEVVKEVHEYIHLYGDTPSFIAGRVDFAIRRYYGGLLPPYFAALKKFTEEGAYSWDAPGHMGGVAYLKHPAGIEFHRFFGENIMRADIGISTACMGSWLDHSGPAGESERMAARIFGSEITMYVLGGSSTSNQIVGHCTVGDGEIVVADRNCHKSLQHTLTVTRARVAYLKPTRNGYGMIGLIPFWRFGFEQVRRLLDASPLVPGAATKEPVLGAVTNSTYDGFCYDVDRVVTEFGKSVPRIHFDEAWYAHARFHPLYRGRYAMGVPAGTPNLPTLFAVQSTHKMLPAFSMASYLHVKNSPRAPVEYDALAEAFMMHGTTSPFYPLVASMDVATAMMDEPSGPTLMDETVEDAIRFRKALASVTRRLASEAGTNGWFFRCYQPEVVSDPATGNTYDFIDAPTRLLKREASCWTLKVSEKWHGFADADLTSEYCMLDPVKVTILCPGIGFQGDLEERGIPGAVLTRFLDSRRIEIARTGDYTVLVLFSVGTSTGKWGALLEALIEFKRHYDGGSLISEVLPELAAKHPELYGTLTLRGLCDAIHGAMRDLRLPQLLQEASETEPHAVLTPAAVYQLLIRYGTEKVRLSEVGDRVAALMLVPYPPGIPILMPGERFGGQASPTTQFLLALQEFAARFPGFERDVHGIEVDAHGVYWVRTVCDKHEKTSEAQPISRRPVVSGSHKTGRS